MKKYILNGPETIIRDAALEEAAQVAEDEAEAALKKGGLERALRMYCRRPHHPCAQVHGSENGGGVRNGNRSD